MSVRWFIWIQQLDTRVILFEIGGNGFNQIFALAKGIYMIFLFSKGIKVSLKKKKNYDKW